MRLYVVAAACLLAGCALDVASESETEAPQEQSDGASVYRKQDGYADPCRYGTHVNGVEVPAYCVEYHGDRGDPDPSAPNELEWRSAPAYPQNGLR
jgi:hypothetical protein